MTITKWVSTGAVACLLAFSPQVLATDHARNSSSKSEAVGVGAGALVGGVVGGPVGAILGAAIGGHYGDTRHQAKANESLALDTQSRLETSQTRLKRAMTEQERLDLELLLAEEELVALNQKIDQLFVERAVVNGLKFDVHFDTDGAAIGQTDQQRLMRLSELLKAVPEAQVELHGFADARGSSEYNEVLSLDRAHTVADTLSALGVDALQIKTFAQGESQASYRGDDIEAYSHDRRVSIQLKLPQSEASVAAVEQVPQPVAKQAASGQ